MKILRHLKVKREVLCSKKKMVGKILHQQDEGEKPPPKRGGSKDVDDEKAPLSEDDRGEGEDNG